MNDVSAKVDELLAKVAALSAEVLRLRETCGPRIESAPLRRDLSDLVGMWIEGCCEQGRFSHRRSDLYARFDRWLEKGESASNQAFYRELAARGFVQHKSNGERYVVGIRPRTVDNSAA